MNQLFCIKNAIERLYKTNPDIHISVDIPRPRITVEKTRAVITGVYRNFFQIEEYDRGCSTRHTIQYGDVLIGHVVIEELHGSLK
ncbi:MAG: hypothetical protein IJA86_07345 [Clostridia bacterium]|nr:hypothetical protein [Clostridia bacterium]